MKCLKCGAYVYSSDKFCRNCGTTINSDTCQYGDNIANSKYDSSSCHEQQYTYSYQYSNTSKPNYNINASHADQYDYSSKYSFDYSKFNYINKPNDSGGDDKYIKAYIGNNYDKIKKMKFSFPALIFGPWYLLYRKVWGYALGAIIISIAAAILLENDLIDLVNLIINIYFGYKFKSIYMKQAEDKTELIQQQNLDKSTNELLDVCRKKGGTSFKGTIIATTGIIVAYILFIAVLFTGKGFIVLDGDEPTDKINDDITEQQTSGQIDKLSYTLPYGFQAFYSTDSAKIYNYNNGNVSCTFKAEKRIPYGVTSDPDTYLTSIEVSSEIHSINLNNHEWKYKSYNPSNFYQTVYVHKYQDTLYILTLDHTNYYSCNKLYNEILPTIKFQEI